MLLDKYLHERAITRRDLDEVGSTYSESGISYVVFDEYGREVGSIDRRFSQEPRFVLNFRSSESIFLFNSALPSIFASGEAVIVEGPADALALRRAGMENTVAFGGASNFGKRKLRTLRRYCDSFWFIFDRDDAGLKFFKNVRDRQKLVTDVWVTFTPEWKDPAEFLAKGGNIEDFRKLPL